MIWRLKKVQEFLVRYFVIFKNFAEAELKMVSHHMSGVGKEKIEKNVFLPCLVKALASFSVDWFSNQREF